MTDGVRMRRWAGLAAAALFWWASGAAWTSEAIGPGPLWRDVTRQDVAWWLSDPSGAATLKPGGFFSQLGPEWLVLFLFAFWALWPRSK